LQVEAEVFPLFINLIQNLIKAFLLMDILATDAMKKVIISKIAPKIMILILIKAKIREFRKLNN
jgi:hypothetical protein